MYLLFLCKHFVSEIFLQFGKAKKIRKAEDGCELQSESLM